jgi:tRNA G18 (ribose-2'-O)-methylase SpoU
VAGIEHVDDAADVRVAAYRDLEDAGLAARDGLFVAESRVVVRRLLAGSRFRTRSVLCTRTALDTLRDVIEPRLGGDLPVYLTRLDTMRRIVGFDFHRGCLALGERGPAPAPEALLAASRLVVIVERLANQDNVGGVFRNATAFGADAVLLSPGSADPLSRKAVRVSVGGSLTTPFTWLPEWPSALARVRAAGFTLVALTPRRGAVDIADLVGVGRAPARVALLVGNEGDGLSPAARAAADVEVAIAMAPGVDSLNVATAAAIALHRFTAAR